LPLELLLNQTPYFLKSLQFLKILPHFLQPVPQLEGNQIVLKSAAEFQEDVAEIEQELRM
jgi:hypothetical protein